jgi:mannose/fructose/N-acetylgalactosamine-specific phosphotransferase system component IIC
METCRLEFCSAFVDVHCLFFTFNSLPARKVNLIASSVCGISLATWAEYQQQKQEQKDAATGSRFGKIYSREKGRILSYGFTE